MSKDIGLFKKFPGYKDNFNALKLAFEMGGVGLWSV